MIPFGIMYLKEIQAQCVSDYTKAGQTHGCRSEHWIELPTQNSDKRACCQWNTDNVVDKCPKQVFVNVTQ